MYDQQAERLEATYKATWSVFPAVLKAPLEQH